MGMQARSDPAGCAATNLSRGRGRLAIGAAARGRRDPFKACGRRRRRRSRLREVSGARQDVASRAGPLGIEVQRLRHHEPQAYEVVGSAAAQAASASALLDPLTTKSRHPGNLRGLSSSAS